MSGQTFCTSFTFKPGSGSTVSSGSSSTPQMIGVPPGEAPQAGALAQGRTNVEAAQQVAAMNLSPATMAAYRKKFNAFDLNKDGIITRREFLAVSKVFGYSLTSQEVMEIFGKTDTDESGGITFDEFVIAMVKRTQRQKQLEPVKAKLRLYDKKGRGYITADEAYPVLKKELGFSESKTEALVDMYDKNRDYRLTMLEFLEFQHRVEELKAQIEAGFREFDRNGDGLVDLNELMAAMIPKGFTPDQVQGLMQRYDEDRDGCLNYEEFAVFWDIPIQ